MKYCVVVKNGKWLEIEAELALEKDEHLLLVTREDVVARFAISQVTAWWPIPTEL